MTDNNEINRVIARARTRRTEYIGSAIEAYALPAVLVAGLSLMLLSFGGTPAPSIDEGAQVAHVTSVER